MLEIIKTLHRCTIVFSVEISDSDEKELKKIFLENFSSYEIKFISLYIISSEMIMLLYEQIYTLKKNIEISVNKYRLSRYLHQLGFKSNLISSLSVKQVQNPNPNILVIGGSADSSKKIIDILSGFDTKAFSIFIIQHIDKNSHQIFDSILRPYVGSNVVYAENGMKVEKSTIYIAPANQHLLVQNNTIILDETKEINFARPSISVSFKSLAKEYQDNAVFILECGYGEDGVDALSYLKKQNATVVIQDPSECEAKTIPLSSLHTLQYNYRLKVQEIATFMSVLVMHFDTPYQIIEFLFEKICEQYEYDFRFYQKEYLQRRLYTFMVKHSIKDIKVAVILILSYKPAFKSLFLDLSINVTEFFRDEKSLHRLCEILKKDYSNSSKIKIWSAGCSSGKEVYSMGIILKNLGLIEKSLIYATDFNPVVIQEAKNGIYSLKQFDKAIQNYEKLGFDNNLQKEFEFKENFVIIKESIKKNILFFTHNLEKDSMFNEFDIIECKNVLIYFDDILKNKTLKLLYASLKFGGYLALGASELLPLEFDTMFQKYDEQYNIYKKVS